MLKNLLRNLFPHRGMFALAAVMLLANSCNDCDHHQDLGGEIEKVVPETEIFISEATTAAQSRTIEDPNTALPVTVTLAKALSSDVTFTLDADAQWVEDYNETHGTNWALLPESGRDLTVKRTIPAGSTTADPVNLNVTLPTDAATRVYVLPVYIADVWGAAEVREAQSHLIYLFVKGNFVYFEQAVSGEGTQAYKVETGSPVTLPFDVGLVDPVSSTLNITLRADANVVSKYNAQFGTNYQQLPAQHYTWASNGSVSIPAGSTSAAADIVVNSLPEGTAQYAIGVSIVSVTGDSNVKVKADQCEWIYLLRRGSVPAIQKGAVFTGYSSATGMPSVSLGMSLPQWTIEYFVRHDSNFSDLDTSSLGWLLNNGQPWRQRVFCPQSVPVSTPIADFKFWPQGGDMGPLLQFTGQAHSLRSSSNGYVWKPDTWTHFAITYDGTSIRYYIDGQQYNFGGPPNDATQPDLGEATAISGITSWNTMTLAHPGANASFIRYYKIELAQLRLWNRQLSTEELNENIGFSVFPDDVDGLVGYWKMDEGEGTTLNDASGKGHNITWSKLQWSDSTYDFTNNNGN